MAQMKTEAEQIAFFDAVYEKFEAARAATSRVCLDFSIAGSVMRVELAGPELVPFYTRALGHLRIGDAHPEVEPDVTLCLWDSRSTGVAMVPPPWRWDAVGDRGDLWGFGSRRIKTAFHYHDHSLSVLDHERRVGVLWVQTTEGLPYWTVASPLRTLIHWWMQRRGCQLVHGAALAQGGAALLLVGKGGVGKSSTALTGLEQGLGFLGDDYVIVRPGPVPMVYSLYASAKLKRADLDRYPGYREDLYRTPTAADEKAVVLLYPGFAERLVCEAPLAALAMPRVVDSEATRFAAESPEVIRQAATVTTMAQLPYAGEVAHQAIATLCGSLDGYRIELGRDKADVARAIGAFLTEPRPGAKRVAAQAVRPLLSVVIHIRAARFLSEAVASVLAQGYPALEIIVVDDGDSEGTEAIVRALPVEVHYLRHDGRGPASARNRGIRNASGDYLAMLDGDDRFAEGALVTLMHALLADPTLDVVQGDSRATGHERDGFEDRDSGEALADPSGSCVYRRRIFERVGLFDAALHVGEDREWFKRLGEHGVVPHKVNTVSLMLRRRGGDMAPGKTSVELDALRVLKLALDRKRRRDRGEGESP